MDEDVVKKLGFWAHTEKMEARLFSHYPFDLDEHDGRLFYAGRPLICRDSPIDGGVYLGHHRREAIVVDSVKYPKTRELYDKAKQLATIDGTLDKSSILFAVYSTVSRAFPKQDDNLTWKVVQQYDVEGDGKISLDRFLEAGAGVCRHDALACGVILELFAKEGHISGKPSIDRNMNHAWCRYTNSKRDVVILDVRMRYFGYLQDASQMQQFMYLRPEEY